MPRKGKHVPQYVPLIQNLAENGATYIEIADSLNIPMRTLRKWEREYQAVFDALTPAYKNELRRRLAREFQERQEQLARKQAKRLEAKNAR
jgi:uncharacterized protein YjcR